MTVGIHLPHNRVGRRIAAWLDDVVQSVGALLRDTTSTESSDPPLTYPPHRERFIERARMEREMRRL